MVRVLNGWIEPRQAAFQVQMQHTDNLKCAGIQALGELEKKWCPELQSRDSNEAGTMVVRALIQLPMPKDRRLQIKFHIAQGGGHIYPRAHR